MQAFVLPAHLAPLVSELRAVIEPEMIIDHHPAYARLTSELESDSAISEDWAAYLFANWDDGFYDVSLAAIVEEYSNEVGDASVDQTDEDRLRALSDAAHRLLDQYEELDRAKHFAVPLGGENDALVFLCLSYTTGTEMHPNKWHGVAATAEVFRQRFRRSGRVLSVTELESLPRELRLTAISS